MLGEYAVKLPTSLIVGKRTASSAASPELVRAGNGVRWAVLQEPDKKDVINVGLLKELSGNDSFFARGLFKEGGEIEPMFKLVVICNDPPSMPYSDKAAWNRIRVIPFESTFCDNPPNTWEEQLREKKFPKDPFFAEKIPDMIQAFAWLLLNHRKNGIRRIEPDKVTLATNSYRIKNDIYRQFIEECTVEDSNSLISLSEVYGFFKEWFKDSMPHHVVPVKNEVKEYFIRLWGEPSEKGCKWKGYRLFNYQEENVIVLDEKDLIDYNNSSVNNLL
jgi:phage/plasmid-associated DNA primase